MTDTFTPLSDEEVRKLLEQAAPFHAEWPELIRALRTVLSLMGQLEEYQSEVNRLCFELAKRDEPSPCGVEGHRRADWVEERHVTTDEHECTYAECQQAHCLACQRGQAERAAVVEACCKSQCLLCHGDRDDVNPVPQYLERQYVPNCGEMEGWVHHRNWGGFYFCSADRIRSAHPDTAKVMAERDGKNDSKE